MAGINKVILIGNLGRDPELKFTPSGVAVANFSMATSEEWKDKETGEKKEQTEWHRIVSWRRLAEICGEYLKKGSKVYIEGKLQTRSWEDSDGVTKYATEVVAHTMQMLGGNPQQDQQPRPKKDASAPQANVGWPADDDVPF